MLKRPTSSYVDDVFADPTWSEDFSRPSGSRTNATTSSSSGTGARPPKRQKIGGTKSRTIWNSRDDWDELVATSSLSTASVSTRRPLPRGLVSLSKAAEDVAVRYFKMLYEAGQVVDYSGKLGKGWWETEWAYIPDDAKKRIRDGVFRTHGSYLSLDVLRRLFIIPPEYVLPGHLLPCLIAKPGIRPPLLHPAYNKQMLSLKIQHCPQMTDAAIADTITHMPNLRSVNLKGCSLVGERTCAAILGLKDLSRVNLKGTKASDPDLTAILKAKADELEVFKVDTVVFADPDSSFNAVYPKLTHLCIPGTTINAPAGRDFQARARMLNHALPPPTARAADRGSRFDWVNFGSIFPALTHLYLPGLLIPPNVEIRLPENTLIKFSTGPGGPPIPISVLGVLLESQTESLESLHIGHVTPTAQWSRDAEADKLAEAFAGCTKMKDFRWMRDASGKQSALCETFMQHAGLMLEEALLGSWQDTLKHLHLELPRPIPAAYFDLPPVTTGFILHPLETLALPNTGFGASSNDGSATPYAVIQNFPMLRSLDLSNTSVTKDEVFDIIGTCSFLSRIDLTSCRGVDVRLRRRAFAAWKEAKAEAEAEAKGKANQEAEGRRSRRRG